MKKVILFITVILSAKSFLIAQKSNYQRIDSAKYIAAMLPNVNAADTANSIEELNLLVNNFERIASA